jgi:hypothetical protein
MKLFRTLGAAVALVALAACSTPQDQADVQGAVRKASAVALTTYADIFQPAVLSYGSLPDCPQAAICKDRATLNQLKAVDAKAVAAITAARPILNGSAVDTGRLGEALAAIMEAQAAIARSGALRLSK